MPLRSSATSELFGTWLRKKREASGLSRQRLVYLIHLFYGVPLTEETIRRHERGLTEPRFATVRAYVGVLGRPPETITGFVFNWKDNPTIQLTQVLISKRPARAAGGGA